VLEINKISFSKKKAAKADMSKSALTQQGLLKSNPTE